MVAVREPQVRGHDDRAAGRQAGDGEEGGVIYPQMLLDLHGELIVDLFAGGGGASVGIEMALGRMVDVAVNHDPAALAMHRINHPQTYHDRSDVFEVDPHEITQGRPVGLLWASPDCTFFSKALGGKPIRSAEKKRRALAWVVKRWAGQVRPRVIMLENVEEFQEWGPLVGPPDRLRPCPRKKGTRFRAFVGSLERMGYRVEWRELRACDYGAPTIRKRLFVIARSDGRPIVWPEPTHGPETGRPHRTAADCIDWSTPMPSIFLTPEEARDWARAQRAAGHEIGTPRRPLAEATMRRIARGVMKFVVENPRPFIVNLAQRGPREYPLDQPLRTQHAGGNAFALVNAFLTQNNGGFYDGAGRDLREPMSTVLNTGSHQSLVYAFLQKYYGAGTGQELGEPMHTIPTLDRFGLVTVEVDGQSYVIRDIAMRMLTPRELYRAQGFPDSYTIDRGADGRKLTKAEQVRMVGNSVCPPIAAALARANVPDLIARDEALRHWPPLRRAVRQGVAA